MKESLKLDKIHPFDELCKIHDTGHRATKFAHPWTHKRVEEMSHIIKSTTLKLFHYETIDDYSKQLVKFLNYYNFSKKLKSLELKSPYDIILQKYESQLSLFRESVKSLCGLNILSGIDNDECGCVRVLQTPSDQKPTHTMRPLHNYG